jgi:arabinofuranan 3-O-arabinosyltransferase
VVDGFAAGWRVNAAPGDVIHITFGPSRTAFAAWLASGAALLVSLLVLVLGSRGAPTVSARSASRSRDPGRRGYA